MAAANYSNLQAQSEREVARQAVKDIEKLNVGSMGKAYIAAKESQGKDALDDAVYRLLRQLDLEDDGTVDVIFDPNKVRFELTRAGGVQSLWGPVKFKLIVWM